MQRDDGTVHEGGMRKRGREGNGVWLAAEGWDAWDIAEVVVSILDRWGIACVAFTA